ncbi:MAG: hypothetical protein M3437_12090 [Chloroflexota bacterium]|nr:hypothetical protein [Chloroflexota bacterium]MDQ5865012.1 hypothetical protein [Chloroflexota bacterium]
MPDGEFNAAKKATIDIVDLSAELQAIRLERDWLRRLVEDLTSVNAALAGALQEKRILEASALQTSQSGEDSSADSANAHTFSGQIATDPQRMQSKPRHDIPTSGDRAAS